MPITTTTLTGPIYMPNGATPYGGKVHFELTSWDQEPNEALFTSGPYVALIDENGYFEVELFTTSEGNRNVNYRMYVSWFDSNGAGDYTNQAFNTHGTNNFIKEYIGAFSLSGPGPYQVSDITIVNESQLTGTFDLFTEFKALNQESKDAAVSAAADALIISNTKDKLNNLTITSPVDLDYLDTQVQSLVGGFVHKGDWDASTGAFPNASNSGWFYRVSVSGVVDGVEFDVEDSLISRVDGASTLTFDSNWLKLDSTDKVSSVSGRIGVVTTEELASDYENLNNTNKFSDSEKTKLNNLISGRDVATMTWVSQLPDNSVVFVEGKPYQVDHSLGLDDPAITGTDPAADTAIIVSHSCAADLDVPFIKPFGTHHLEHFGQEDKAGVLDAVKVARWKSQAEAQSAPYMRFHSAILGGFLDLSQTGAQPQYLDPDTNTQQFGPDASAFINQAILDVGGKETGGQIYTGSDRYSVSEPIQVVPGSLTQPLTFLGNGKSSSWDFRLMDRAVHGNSCVVFAAPEAHDGPTYINFDGMDIRGDAGQNMTAIDIDFMSGSRITRSSFQLLARAIKTRESFALSVDNNRFNNIDLDAVQFNSNAHSFRFLNNTGNDVARGGGAVLNFNTDENSAETHTVTLLANNIDKIGSLIRTTATSGGITGLTVHGFYTEGYVSGQQLFDFAPIGVRGFEWIGGSLSVAGQDVVANPPDVQVINYVKGGRVSGIRCNGITVEQGANTEFFDWEMGNNIIGGAPDFPAPAWRDVTLLSGFTSVADFEAAGYLTTKDGYVTLRGVLDHGSAITANTSVFVLPVGVRPRALEYVNAKSPNGLTKLLLNTNGAVQVRANAGSPADQIVDLSGIRFKAAE